MKVAARLVLGGRGRVLMGKDRAPIRIARGREGYDTAKKLRGMQRV